MTVTVPVASACHRKVSRHRLGISDGVPGASVSTITVAAVETLPPVPLALVAVAVKARGCPSVKLPVGVSSSFRWRSPWWCRAAPVDYKCSPWRPQAVPFNVGCASLVTAVGDSAGINTHIIYCVEAMIGASGTRVSERGKSGGNACVACFIWVNAGSWLTIGLRGRGVAVKLPVPPSAVAVPVPHQYQRVIVTVLPASAVPVTRLPVRIDGVAGRAGRNGIHDNRYRWRSGANVASHRRRANAIGVTSTAERGGWRQLQLPAGIGVRSRPAPPLSKR